MTNYSSLPSDELARKVIEHSVDGLLVIDAEGVVRFANPAAISLFAGRTTELVGFHLGAPAIHEPVELILPSGTSPRYVEMRSTEIIWEGRTASLASLRDITERKLAEEALRQSESRFRKVVDRAPEGIYVVVDGRFQYLNPAAVATFGAETPDQLIGQLSIDRVHQDYHVVVTERVRLLSEKQESAPPLEEQFVRLDGTVFDVEVTAVPLTFEGREGAMVFFRDITSRKRAEQILRESEERFRSLFEHAPIAYSQIDQRGAILRVNRAHYFLHGHEANELVGKFVWDFVAPDLRESVRQAVIEKLNGSRPAVPFEIEILRKDGSAVPVEIHEKLIYSTAGEIEGFLAALLDISARKIAQQASRKAEQYTLDFGTRQKLPNSARLN
jgi:PAS domain S-box-containing protein